MKAISTIFLFSSSTGSSWPAICHLGLNLQWKLHTQSLKALPQVSSMHQHRLRHLIYSSGVKFRKAALLESKSSLDLAADLRCGGVVLLKYIYFKLLFGSVWYGVNLMTLLDVVLMDWLVCRYLELSLRLFKESLQQTTVLVQETSFFVLGCSWALSWQVIKQKGK